RRPALIRDRSHPIRFANDVGSLYAIHTTGCLVSPTGADSQSLAPHSLRERYLARCLHRHLARCSQRYNRDARLALGAVAAGETTSRSSQSRSGRAAVSHSRSSIIMCARPRTIMGAIPYSDAVALTSAGVDILSSC